MKRIILLPCLLLYGNIFAQQHLSDTAFQIIASRQAKKITTVANTSQSGLFNGTEFIEPRQSSYDQFPYWISNDWVTGAVHYDGVLYTDVALMYDIVNDQLATMIPQNGNEIRLVPEKITYFTINDINFVKLNHRDLTPGFYACLYDGKTKVYARYEKSTQEKIEAGMIRIDYPQKSKYYILKNEKYFSVKSKGDVLKVLSDRKADLRQFANKEQINFNKNKERSLNKLARFYDNVQP